jgi:hypothetical protein
VPQIRLNPQTTLLQTGTASRALASRSFGRTREQTAKLHRREVVFTFGWQIAPSWKRFRPFQPANEHLSKAVAMPGQTST